MKIHIDDILNNKNKTRYWLAKKTDLNYASLVKLCENITTSIRFDTLEKICNILNCTPDEFFGIKK